MYIVKFGSQYLGLVDAQGAALRFTTEERNSVVIALDAMRVAGMTGPVDSARIVKLTTLADRTAESMRGLAQDVEGDQ